MARINRYDTPAESNYFNTFVPLPLDQITALGMKRQEDLERKQDAASKYIDQASLVDYIANSKDEEWVKQQYLPQIQKLAEEAMSTDLSNPVEWAKYSTRLRTTGTSDKIRRIEESKSRWNQAQEMKQKLIAAGRYNQLLDEDPAIGWDSETGIYNYMPEAYTDKSELFEQYYKHMKPQSKGIVTLAGGIRALREGIDMGDVRNISDRAAQELAVNPLGQQQVKLFRKMYGDLSKDMSDVDILKMQMEDYGRQYITSNDQVLPEFAQGPGGPTKQPNLWGFNEQFIPTNRKSPDILQLSDSLGLSKIKSKEDRLTKGMEGVLNTGLYPANKTFGASEEFLTPEQQSNAARKIVERYPHMAFGPDGKKISDKQIVEYYKEMLNSPLESVKYQFTNEQARASINEMFGNSLHGRSVYISSLNENMPIEEFLKKTGYTLEEVQESLLKPGEAGIKIAGPSLEKPGYFSMNLTSDKKNNQYARAIKNGDVSIQGNGGEEAFLKPLYQLRNLTATGLSEELPIGPSPDGDGQILIKPEYDYNYENGKPRSKTIYKVLQQHNDGTIEQLKVELQNGQQIDATTTLNELYNQAMYPIFNEASGYNVNKETQDLRYTNIPSNRYGR